MRAQGRIDRPAQPIMDEPRCDVCHLIFPDTEISGVELHTDLLMAGSAGHQHATVNLGAGGEGGRAFRLLS